jgi:hypothetical protein
MSLTLGAKPGTCRRTPQVVGATVAPKQALVELGAEQVGHAGPVEWAAHGGVVRGCRRGAGRDGLRGDGIAVGVVA